MIRNRGQRPNAKGVKAEADRRFREIARRAKQYKGTCLFPVDANGGLCRESIARRHVIPRSSVLDQLKDGKSGKVMDLDWGVDQWAAPLLKSDEGHPLNLEDPATFEPRTIGTHEACTGLYACGSHDAVFNPIDVAKPDFTDPFIRWLTMGRIALYAADLCTRRKFLVDGWKSTTMRSGSKGLRASWLREAQFAYTAYDKGHVAAKKWGKAWKSSESPHQLAENQVEWSAQNFRSDLRMAACFYYGKATTVVILPVGGHDHQMVLLHWAGETGGMEEDEERLTSKARESATGDNYGVGVLTELMSRGSGAVAASPESYRKMADDQKTEVQRILMRGLEASGIAQALREDLP